MMKNKFERELAKTILAKVKEPGAKGRVRRMSVIGHFNRMIFMPEVFLEINFMMFVRFMVNLSMELPHKEFMNLWDHIGQRMEAMADLQGDLFNNLHKRSHGGKH